MIHQTLYKYVKAHSISSWKGLLATVFRCFLLQIRFRVVRLGVVNRVVSGQSAQSNSNNLVSWKSIINVHLVCCIYVVLYCDILWVYLKGIRRFENSIERCSNPYFPSCLHLVYQYWLTAKEEIRSLKSNFWTFQFELSKLSVFNNLHHSLCIFPIFFSMRCFLKSILNILHFLFIERQNTIYLKNTVHMSVYPRTLKCLDE